MFSLFFRVTYHTGRDQRVPPFNFFRHCETFFRIFFPKGPPCIFLMFCDRMNVGKSQRVPPFSFFGIVRLLRKKVFLKRVPFNCFDILQQIGCLKIPFFTREGPLFCSFVQFDQNIPQTLGPHPKL